MDNHRAHTCEFTTSSMNDLGFDTLFMPPHSSQLNPVEQMWRAFKHHWCQRAFMRVDFDPTPDNIQREIVLAMSQIGADAAVNLVKACHGLYAEVLLHQPGDPLPRGLPWVNV